MENLLASPEIVNPSLLVRNPLINNHPIPIVPPISEEIVNKPNISGPNIIEEIPVASDIPILYPEPTIINPIPVAVPIEPIVDNNLPITVRGVSRIPVLSPVLNPTITRLRTSNAKPKGFYKS
ncbi:unnamed protein product [Rotaria magnacalcarata]|uniref:Uncharacterized protein n=2 Tax=Rotaria magnacalcarata TaxID=392030 RepID=A0A820FA79_9BILA|nr:unnamed protein product [Rotaria magnacalcarata]